MIDPSTAAIEHLYATFARYEAPAQLEGCPCCVEAHESADLLSVPLRDLTQDQLGRYAGKAMTTWGSVTDYKHFLPRVLDLAIGPHGYHGLHYDCVASRLEYARWREWPAAEQQAIRAFAQSWWRIIHEAWPARCDPIDWLANFGEPILGDVPALLEEWAGATSDAAVFALAQTMYDHWVEQGDFTAKRSPRHWNGSPEGGAAVGDWFRSPDRRSALERTLVRATDPEGVRVVAYVLEMYEFSG